MDAKETILTVIKENGWVVGVRRFDLLADLQHYNMSADVLDLLLQECLSQGFITVENERYKITHRGQKYLQNIARINYTEVAHHVANSSNNNSVLRKRWSMEKWSWFAGIVGAVTTILAFLYQYVFKK